MGSSNPVDSTSDLVLLLLHANEQVHGREVLAGTTKLQKLLFLLSVAPTYRQLVAMDHAPDIKFEPYKMGPFSRSIFDAVDLLTNFSPPLLVATAADPGTPDETETQRYADEVDLDRVWSSSPRPATYSLTDDGKRLAKLMWEAAPPELRGPITRIVREYAHIPLRDLLRRVYTTYPAMTERSQIKRELGL